MKRPILPITMGDPAGVGAEVCVRAALRPDVLSLCTPLLVGDTCLVQSALAILGVCAEVRVVSSLEEVRHQAGRVHLLPVGAIHEGEWAYGRLSASCGRAAYAYIARAIRLAMDFSLPAVVTAPIHKEALKLAGCAYPGHTEIFAALTGTTTYAMMLTSGNLRISHVSTHVSLAEACKHAKKGRIIEVIGLTDQALRRMGFGNPRIAVAGLNPHGGEHGLFGTEEIEEIAPAVEFCRAQGYFADGPISPDTVFVKAAGGLYDAVVAMYHDQGHIPAKLAGFRLEDGATSVHGTNMTLGLPFLRTSVDHGTAFDIAGTGRADEGSMVDAILQAAQAKR